MAAMLSVNANSHLHEPNVHKPDVHEPDVHELDVQLCEADSFSISLL